MQERLEAFRELSGRTTACRRQDPTVALWPCATHPESTWSVPEDHPWEVASAPFLVMNDVEHVISHGDGGGRDGGEYIYVYMYMCTCIVSYSL